MIVKIVMSGTIYRVKLGVPKPKAIMITPL